MHKSQKTLQPIHPGEVLQKDFLDELGLSQYRLSKDINVPPRRINEIVKGLRSISADTALRLSKYFGTTAEFWLNLQSKFDLDSQRIKIADELNFKVKIMDRAALAV